MNPVAQNPEYTILNKIAYGPCPRDLSRIRQIGIAAYLEEQLNPQTEDTICDQRLANARYKIEYKAGHDESGRRWPACNENRALNNLTKDCSQLWQLVNGTRALEWSEKIRPAEEVRVATILRAIYSRWQLREVLTQFWHNHFNVNVDKDERIAALLPVYDREVIRKHCMGNFRDFLGSVATSAAMGYYLDNASSRASPANENYARELFELHTLGAENYFNHLYNRWSAVPHLQDGRAIGYIDQDVYEAARAFTGWTVADGGDNGKGEPFPNNGRFHYYEGWHDNYQKRVLSIEFDCNQPPMADGKKVLDLVANHPATARRICKKLCIRLMADHPPASVVERATQVWLAETSSPDQIKKVVRTIITSPEMLQSFGGKVKNPLEYVISFLRSTASTVTPNASFLWQLAQMGYSLYSYNAPTGHPDTADHWLSTSSMANRWTMISYLTSDWMEAAKFDLQTQTPVMARTSRQIARYWVNRLLGATGSTYYETLSVFMANQGIPDLPPAAIDQDPNDLRQRLNSMIATIAMLPEFQQR